MTSADGSTNTAGFGCGGIPTTLPACSHALSEELRGVFLGRHRGLLRQPGDDLRHALAVSEDAGPELRAIALEFGHIGRVVPDDIEQLVPARTDAPMCERRRPDAINRRQTIRAVAQEQSMTMRELFQAAYRQRAISRREMVALIRRFERQKSLDNAVWIPGELMPAMQRVELLYTPSPSRLVH